ncbi:hypothetical protein CNMCM6106_009623 [Aspergillus hiratsukae]|uniref:Amino acid transporter n=1 Tax=Aspergillus hiratsukae TaxID=1194566 RepID=A0A8H6PKQ7_9EURO|nr:hypothetical protein CNMCM6106_009623 [Aspergillus hiratsukae]
MMWTKNKSVVYTTTREDEVSAKGGTAQDRKDMWRVGRQQELNRNFRFLSVLGFTAVLMCTWEAVLFGASYGLINGGKGGMIYTYLGGLVGFSFVILSMAEMASMAPTSGGQYHWVSEFAPPSCQRILSYITGWVCVLGWHTGIAGCCYTVANMMVGVVAINYPDTYTYEPWHVTLLVIAVALVALLFNTVLAQKLPLIEGIILVIHCFGFFGISIPLWVLSPRPAASEVFGSIEDRGGWGNNGLACLVGLVGPIYALIVQSKGPDSAVHMSEEIRDASRVLPLGMIWTLILNGSTGFVMIVTLAFCVGDIDHVLESQTGFAFIQVFLNSTGSVRAATGMTVVIMVMQFCAAISNVATTSRQVYAFARDKGLPFSSFLSKINPTFTVPLNALCVSLVIVSLLSLINIGSSVAFNAIMSLGTAALLSSYIISITCVRIRRWRKQPLPPARWSMGRFTPFVDTVSILVLLVIWVYSFFPLTKHVNPTTMNWSVEPSAGQLTILKFTGLAVTGLRAALADPAETLKPETAMTAMVLCTNDVCNGNARTWKVHLSGVMQLLTALLERQRTIDRDIDPFALCLLKWFATLDILAGLSGTHEGCVNDGQYWNLTRRPHCGIGQVDEICGYSTQLMPLLARIGQLARRNVHEQSILETFTEPSSTLSEELTDEAQDLERKILSIADQSPSAAALATHDEVLASELHNTHLAFLHSALLHLYRRVELLPKSHPKVKAQVAAILDNVQAIKPFSPANVLILWPIFSAGCETDDLQERQAIRTRMANMQTMGMGNFTRARDALARYWESGAGLRWDIYFAQSGLELVLF